MDVLVGFIHGLGAILVTQALNGSKTVRLLRGTTVPGVLALVGPLLPKDVTTLLPAGLPGPLPFRTPKP
jgi:MFS superfamily sulfate permease-like transporter